MIEEKKSCNKTTSMDPGISVYDIDIDFELRNGQPVWVVILERNNGNPQPLQEIDMSH